MYSVIFDAENNISQGNNQLEISYGWRICSLCVVCRWEGDFKVRLYINKPGGLYSICSYAHIHIHTQTHENILSGPFHPKVFIVPQPLFQGNRNLQWPSWVLELAYYLFPVYLPPPVGVTLDEEYFFHNISSQQHNIFCGHGRESTSFLIFYSFGNITK